LQRQSKLANCKILLAFPFIFDTTRFDERPGTNL
jgi:hypothetical protein